jgi:hypothetical protein
MPQITITLDLTPEAVIDLITRSASTRVIDFKANGSLNKPQAYAALPKTKAGAGRGRTPKISGSLNDYRRQPGDKEGLKSRGRPSVLNVAGQRLVWNLYQKGFSYAEIGARFAPIVNRESIRRLIKNIAATPLKET